MTDQTPQEAKQKPIATHRAGTSEIAIWKRETERGTFFDATHTRSYKDQNGDWQTAKSIPEDHLLKTAQLFEKAYNTIQDIKEQDRQRYVEQQQQRSAAPGPTPEHPREH